MFPDGAKLQAVEGDNPKEFCVHFHMKHDCGDTRVDRVTAGGEGSATVDGDGSWHVKVGYERLHALGGTTIDLTYWSGKTLIVDCSVKIPELHAQESSPT